MRPHSCEILELKLFNTIFCSVFVSFYNVKQVACYNFSINIFLFKLWGGWV